ncbi:hypothetical protein [Paenibacillus sp. RC67]|uniref:hypothetical protein n=1 Tax=Paenibacillus sp. RC67 TaxID=3039392 RepID=UPI0024AD7187|nr:hypothetical protein [Paenibacillus sp. RC67]
MTYNMTEISKFVGFFRKHQPIPDMDDVLHTYKAAIAGDKNAAIRMLDWKRHCFYVKNAHDQQVMSVVFAYCGQLFNAK